MPTLRPTRLLCLVAVALLGAAPLAAGDAQPPRTAESAVTPVDRNPRKHEANLARIKEGPVGLLFLGDSITAMWPFTSPTWKKFEKYQVANFGISGERTEDLLWRVQNGELDGIDPKAVVLLIGTNNLGNKSEDPAWTAAGIKAIIGVIQAKLPKAQIVLIGILPRGTGGADDPLTRRVDAVNGIIKGYAVPDKVTYVDVSAGLRDAQGIADKDLFDNLHLHPNGKGFKVLADGVTPIIRKICD